MTILTFFPYSFFAHLFVQILNYFTYFLGFQSLIVIISKDFATTYCMTSITGKTATQKQETYYLSVKRDFCDKNSLQNTKKVQIRYLLSDFFFFRLLLI